MISTRVGLGTLLVTGLSFGVTIAAAAQLGAGSSTLATGGSVIANCQDDAFDVSATLEADDRVSAVTVANIQAPCRATPNRLDLTLTNADGIALASGSATDVTSDSVTIPVSPTPARADVAHAAVAIEGR